MTDDILGMPLEIALERLRSTGIENPEVTQTCAPRRGPGGEIGNLRVIRALDGGTRILVARFPDEVERDI